MISNEQLIQQAKEVVKWRKLSDNCTVGDVGAALLTASGNVYVGISIDASCGIGFCAEHSAVAQMVTKGESKVMKVVALTEHGHFLPPCGRCRELLFQINRENLKAEVLLGPHKMVTLEQLLPERWQETW
jgi:cytidine deaminase